MEFDEFVREGTIKQLSAAEKKDYISFHSNAYKEDIKVAEKLSLISPRWTIVAGYYAMHDITKLYLAEQHNLKLSQRGVHAAAIVALRKVLEDKKVKAIAIKLLEKAENIYEIYGSRAQAIPVILSRSKREREKAQYYSATATAVELKKAMDFLEKIVRPYLDLFEKLIEGGKDVA